MSKQPDINGRFNTSQAWPFGGIVSRPMADRHYDVQQFTGASYGTVPGTNWDRGIFYRWGTQKIRLPRENQMFDPTDISTWGAKYGDFAGYQGFRAGY